MFIDHLDVGKGAVLCGAYSRFLAIFLFCQMPFSWWPVIYTMMWLIMVNWNNQMLSPPLFHFFILSFSLEFDLEKMGGVEGRFQHDLKIHEVKV